LKNNTGLKTIAIHRLVLLAFCGAPEKGQQCRHLNGVRADDRLKNLCYGTVQQNQLDRNRHGTSNRGERNTWNKLTANDVRRIRRLLKTLSQFKIAKQYGIHQSAVSSIKNGRIWGWLDKKEDTRCRILRK
jgi:hypothetical protein